MLFCKIIIFQKYFIIDTFSKILFVLFLTENRK